MDDIPTLVARWQAATGSFDLAGLSAIESYPTRPLAQRLDHGAASPAQLFASRPGRGYTPQGELGRGGMGIVLLATQECQEREVALKVLDLEAVLEAERPLRLRRFLAESLCNARLEHPNIVPVHDLCLGPSGELQLAMKRIGGRSWEELLREQGSALERDLEILLHVCHAVELAHSRGVAHLDLKPSNVLVGDFGEVLLADWGLAVEFGEPKPGSKLIHRHNIAEPCGTPAYMPPELAHGDGEAIGPASDVYLLGGLLFRILTGEPPHSGRNLLQVILGFCQGRAPRLPAEVPRELREICETALATAPAQRFPSALAFEQAVRDYLRHKESLAISRLAREKLDACRSQRSGHAELPGYDAFTEAASGFAQAGRLWPENPEARAGEPEARLCFADAALEHGDAGLAKAQLARLLELPGTPPPALAGLQRRIGVNTAFRARESRNRRRLKAGLVATASLVLLVAGYFLWADARRTWLMVAERQASVAERLEKPPIDTRRLIAAAELALARCDASAEQAGFYPLSEEERGQLEGLITDLMRHVGWREEILRLQREPIGDRAPLIGAGEAEAERERLGRLRHLAARLAVHGQAFEQALLIIDLSGAPEAILARQRVEIEEARQALVARQVGQTRQALLDLQRLSRRDREPWLPTPAEYVAQLSGYRRPQVVDVLAERLGQYSARAAELGAQAAFTAAEREELGVIIDVLGSIELPRFAFEPLRRFFEAVSDPDLLVRAGLALCNTRSPSAELVLDAARERLGKNHSAWRRIARNLGRLPMPDQLETLPSAQAFRARGWVLYEKGRLDDALADFSRAIALDSQDAIAYNRRGVVHLRLGDHDAAIADFDRAVALDSNYMLAFNNRGNAACALKRYADAIADYSRALELDPRFLDAWTSRSLAFCQLGRLDAALQDAEQALALEPGSAPAHTQRGEVLMARRDWSSALTAYQHALELDSGSSRAHLGCGSALRLLGRFEEARQAISRAIELDPRSASAYQTRGRALTELRLFEQAVADFSQALELEADNAVNFVLRGNALGNMGELELALANFTRAVELDSANASFHNHRAEALEDLGHHDQAIAAYSRAIALDPTLQVAYSNRAVLLQMLGQLEAAIADFSRAIELAPDDSRRYYSRAIALDRHGDLQAALADYTRAIELQPREAMAYTNRANLLSRLGRTDEALEDLARASERDPALPQPHAVRGKLLLDQQRHAEALASLDKAVELAPRQPWFAYLRGLAKLQAIGPAAAVEDFERCLALLPEPQHAETAYTMAGKLSEQAALDEALTFLETALRAGFSDMPRLAGDAAFDALRGLPAFAELVERHTSR